MDDLYLDNIDEFVNDHNKIVTYKWLSLTLGVHVNTAKQMLYHYLDHKRKESSAQVHATYLVSGKFVDNGQTGHRVSVVREDQLEDVKSRMSPIRYGAVRCSSAVPMSSLELQQARGARQALPPEPEQKKSSANTDTNVVSKPPSKPQKGIMGMFASKAAPKAQESSRDNKSEQEEAARVDPVQSKPARKPNPGANFFRVQTSKKPAEEKTSSSPPPAEQNLLPSKPQTKQEAAAVEAPKDAKRESRSKTKRVESDSEEDKTEKKKRRRIKKPDPDSSDEDVIPDSPPRMETRRLSPSPEKEIPPVTRSQCGNIEGKVRKRRRVLKSRAFIDDEGCIVTVKDYESESYSETEDDVQATRQAGKDPVPAKPAVSNKQEDKKGHKKSSANANKGAKQASIMGFFQKK
eukprot:XP_011615032.1 PREDICTED: DNA polymerase delta subunit 3 [Takifugu rubripes]